MYVYACMCVCVCIYIYIYMYIYIGLNHLTLKRPPFSAATTSATERPAFLDGMARDVYASTDANSISDRINQSRHYMQRGTRASAEGFMRPS